MNQVALSMKKSKNFNKHFPFYIDYLKNVALFTNEENLKLMSYFKLGVAYLGKNNTEANRYFMKCLKFSSKDVNMNQILLEIA